MKIKTFLRPFSITLSALGVTVLLTTFLEANTPRQLFTSYNGSAGPSLAISNDTAQYEITIHGGIGAKPGGYTLNAIYNFNFTIEADGTLTLPSFPGGPTERIDANTVKFISTQSADSVITDDLLHNPRPHVYANTSPRNYSFTVQDSSSKVYWSQEETINSYYYWQEYNYYLVGVFISSYTYTVRAPQTHHIPFDVYLGYHYDNTPPGGCPKCCGMAGYSFDQQRATLRITDTPVSYGVPRGPGVAFTVNYDQADLGQLAVTPFANLGPKWTYQWLTYITNNPDLGTGTVTRYVPGGGIEHYPRFQIEDYSQPGVNHAELNLYGFNRYSDPERDTRAVLHWDTTNNRYRRNLPDGGFEIYAQAVTIQGLNYYLITESTDAQGNTLTYTYDTQNRLTALTDATGQVTTLAYSQTNPLLISKVTDPFGRAAVFTYDAQGRLQSVRDPVGIFSSFGYGSNNFINALTTPYGTTTFTTDSSVNHHAVTATNPLGQTERVELQFASAPGLADTEPIAPTASGLLLENTGLSQKNTFYWDRRQYALPLDYTKAKITHWMNGEEGLTNVVASTKSPLEGRVWHTYQGQTRANQLPETGSNRATLTARVLDDGTTQASGTVYNQNGMITTSIDPLRRITDYFYDANGIDLLKVSQENGAASEVLSEMTYNNQHLPLTMIDAAGQVTKMTYNAQGQVLTTTNAKNEKSTLVYDAKGYLSTATGALPGATTSYTYDPVGRVKTVTDSEGYVVSNTYDNLDRLIKTTYPDGTSDQSVYKNLDVVQTIDRENKKSTSQYDAIRQLIQTTDPLGRTTKYTWCTCGGLATLTDANNHLTTWNLDLQGRVTGKVYADNSKITYTYETKTSRLKQMVDAMGNQAVYSYNSDNTLKNTNYTPGPGVATTPNVSFTYDPIYNRVATMTDGTGTTTYSYNSVNGALGAGRLAKLVMPVYLTGKNSTTLYTYDVLGRVVQRTTGGVGNVVATTFDPLGRVTQVNNVLGNFVYSYVNTTGRLSGVQYPNGQSTSYGYFDNVGDQRLKEIKNVKGATPLSDFVYAYNPTGTIKTWQQQQDAATPTIYQLSYDAADQLIGAVQKKTTDQSTVTSNLYNYDPAGNRLAEKTLIGTTAGQFNSLNQLIATTSNVTNQTVTGSVSKPVVKVEVNSVPATLTNGTNFTANVPLPAGTNVVSVVAQDAQSTTQTNRFSTLTSGPTPTKPTYDLNGNTTKDEKGYLYTWDALNRLKTITDPNGNKSLFAYDGLSRRVQIVETGTTPSTKNYLWLGTEIVEERDTANTVQKRFLPQGEQQAGVSFYYTRDHLGSVREMCNSSGSIVARYNYDPYGRTITVSGISLPTMQYAGYYFDQTSGLSITMYRTYNRATGRWLSRDPIAERGGLNLYNYVKNNPLSLRDPSGLDGSAENNNCYNYAANRPAYTPVDPRDPSSIRSPANWQPGETLAKQNWPSGFHGPRTHLTCPVFKAVVRLELKGRDPDGNNCCPPGYHKIRLWLPPGDDDIDFHLNRQDGDGTWSCKNGAGAGGGVLGPLPDPEHYNGPDGSYNSCGDLCVPN